MKPQNARSAVRSKLSCGLSAVAGFLSLLILSLFSAPNADANAGIFDLPSFLDQGKFSIGIEGNAALTNGSGAAVNLRPRYGLSDFFNIEGIVGTGAGSRRFRLGAVLDLEFFPDVGSQPGIAAPVTVLYSKIDGDGNVLLSVSPLVYKTFSVDGTHYTPFIAFPLGWNARNSMLKGFTQLTFGSMFGSDSFKHWKFVAEVGFNLYQSYSYIAGGVTFHFSEVRSTSGAAPAGNTGTVEAGADGTIDPGAPKPVGTQIRRQ